MAKDEDELEEIRESIARLTADSDARVALAELIADLYDRPVIETDRRTVAEIIRRLKR